MLFPDSNYHDHQITITKFFERQPFYRWKVESVEHLSSTETVIHLSPRRSCAREVFLVDTYERRGRVDQLLRKGTLVEVEYGYTPSVKKRCGTLKSNRRYPDQKQPGEMHKRRLGIVVKVTGKLVQLVPVSSQVPSAGDKGCFELSSDSIEKMVHYNAVDENGDPKKAFAICSMIETVSLTRILPPLAFPLRSNRLSRPVRSEGYPYRLNPIDREALDGALSHVTGIGDYLKLRRERNEFYEQNKANNEEIERLREELAAKEAELQKASSIRFVSEAQRLLIDGHYTQMHYGKSEQEIREIYQSDLDACKELLQEQQGQLQ